MTHEHEHDIEESYVSLCQSLNSKNMKVFELDIKGNRSYFLLS